MAALNQAKIITALEALAETPAADFIYDFLLAYGTPKATISRLKAGDKQRNAATVLGDVAVPQKLYFRQVAQGVSVADSLNEILALPVLEQHKIRFVLVTDWQTVAAYDRKVKDGTEFDFVDLKFNYEFFLPLTGKYEKAIEHAEHPADVKACEKMGRLYDSICIVNNYGKDDRHILNVFLTRLLFCFFAEDTGIFPQSSQMTLAAKSLTQEDGSDLTDFFSKLFLALSLPDTAPARRLLSAVFSTFPYVNGGLFQEKIQIPRFDKRSRRLLLECGGMQWSDISPVIFGSMFQAVMDQERRRNMGAHYTSEKNILKLVRPLFLDALHEEFAQIQALKKGKKTALQAFQVKIGTLGFLDPACGCGNFLVVSFRELKELELQVVLALRAEDSKTLALDVKFISKVSISQFYGIEIEEFPAEIARVSMWLMEHVMNVQFGKSLGLVIPSIPLHTSAEIVCANALTTPWESVIALEKLHYIMGNPPFAGKKEQSDEQKENIINVFGSVAHGIGNLDYVSAWYRKALNCMVKNHPLQAAFVSTNSICQGEQVESLWKNMFHDGLLINFAYKTFKWKNEARGNAAVHCVIIGFSKQLNSKKFIYVTDKNDMLHIVSAKYINAYLIDAPKVFISKRSEHIQVITQKIKYGNMPIPKDYLVFSKETYNALTESDRSMCRKFIGGDEHLGNSEERYCLWLDNVASDIIQKSSFALARIKLNREWRLASGRQQTIALAERPAVFGEIRQPQGRYLLIPKVSSESRKYIPCGFYDCSVIASGSALIIDGASLYTFGIISSYIHTIWMRTVAGRMKSDYQYSNTIVYNTFPWPETTPQQEKIIEALAQAVLDTRDQHPDKTLAQLYDPDTMPPELQAAHAAMDMAVDRLYQIKPFVDDEQRLQLLFKLYAELVAQKPAASGTIISDEE